MIDMLTSLGSREVLERRNRRTAWVLIGWIAFLMLVSLLVIWLRN